MDAALFRTSLPLVTSLLCLATPSLAPDGTRNPRLTVRWDDGSGLEMDVEAGSTGFVAGSAVYQALSEEEQKWCDERVVEYAPWPCASAVSFFLTFGFLSRSVSLTLFSLLRARRSMERPNARQLERPRNVRRARQHDAARRPAAVGAARHQDVPARVDAPPHGREGAPGPFGRASLVLLSSPSPSSSSALELTWFSSCRPCAPFTTRRPAPRSRRSPRCALTSRRCSAGRSCPSASTLTGTRSATWSSSTTGRACSFSLLPTPPSLPHPTYRSCCCPRRRRPLTSASFHARRVYHSATDYPDRLGTRTMLQAQCVSPLLSSSLLLPSALRPFLRLECARLGEQNVD